MTAMDASATDLPLPTEQPQRTPMKLITGSRAATILVGGLGVTLLAGTAAFAVWSTNGSGNGTAAAATSKPLELTAAASVAGLYPTATDVSGGSINVKNPNAFAVAISSKGFGTVGVTLAAGVTGTCTPTTVTYGFGATQPTSIPANGTVAVPFTASMSNAAQDACQGATFTSLLTVTGASS